MALLPLSPSAPMNQDLVFSLARRRWMFASVLLNPLHPRDPPDPPDPPDPTVTSQSKPPSSSSLRDLHQTPPHSSPPISLPSISTSGFRASCFFHEIYYRGSRTETTQICLTGGGAFLSIVHVSPSSSTAMVLVCSGERNAPSVDGSSSSHGGLSFHSDSGETLIGSSFVKDGISFESPLTASHRNLISISKQLRLQPDYSKSHCLLSDAYSLTLNGNEYDDSLLKFLPVTISWPRHGNVKVRASDPIKPYTSSPNSIVLSSSKVKLELEIHLVSWVSLAVFRAVRVRFNDRSRQLRLFDTIAVEIDSPASLSTRGESFLVFKPVLNSSKSLSLGYFNVVSDYLKLFRAVVSRIQVKIFLPISLL
ncbi:hypothetical protein Bca4012_002853 [Brassica carinata]|uniref:Uncharacterized protein n=2 Tax=Brassica TaxID=3705 RepID=A0A8X7RYB4_BRACI|nr:hypothetical protein Bca52824_042397 [Brassica carinata]CAF1701706.1 unnamed protein product [Brassica napus]CDY31164.1 BnaC03g47270D [Brassica napus]